MPKYNVIETITYTIQTRRTVDATSEDAARSQGQKRAIRDADIMVQLLQLPEASSSETRPATFPAPIEYTVRKWKLTRAKDASQAIQTTAQEVR